MFINFTRGCKFDNLKSNYYIVSQMRSMKTVAVFNKLLVILFSLLMLNACQFFQANTSEIQTLPSCEIYLH